FSYFTEGALGAAGVYHAVLLDFDHSILTVTDNGTGGGGVPEPATWAVMLVGFAGIGAALRRRRPRAA
uniref:PEPxxWA-CTERM sorting domain-containing protein n=1 Tax=Phenylobacterium sp. TaxID=1871053 RepID=UPI003982F4AA